jgi:hypothetical protein
MRPSIAPELLAKRSSRTPAPFVRRASLTRGQVDCFIVDRSAKGVAWRLVRHIDAERQAAELSKRKREESIEKESRLRSIHERKMESAQLARELQHEQTMMEDDKIARRRRLHADSFFSRQRAERENLKLQAARFELASARRKNTAELLALANAAKAAADLASKRAAKASLRANAAAAAAIVATAAVNPEDL